MSQLSKRQVEISNDYRSQGHIGSAEGYASMSRDSQRTSDHQNIFITIYLLGGFINLIPFVMHVT